MQTESAVRNLAAVAPLPTGKRAGKYLIFHLGQEEFGTGVLDVREILEMQDITPVPHTPPHLCGVINLRGRVIPVIDLRLKFGLAPMHATQRTCIIVVRTVQEDGELLMGMTVDGVVEVLTLAEGDIEDTPDFGPGVATPYLTGIAKVKGRVKILLDIHHVLNTTEFKGLSALLQ